MGPFNPKRDRHIIVNYHYVEDPRPEFSGIHPCPVNDFKRQIEFLRRQYEICSVAEVFEAAKTMTRAPRCAITFDDGLRDQYENAVPILRRYGLRAAFFPITGTLRGLLPSAHLIHVLSSHFSMEDLVRRFNALVKTLGEAGVRYHIQTDRRFRPEQRLHEDVRTANFKEMMMVVPKDIRSRFLAECLQEKGSDEKSLVRTLFLGVDEIRRLAAEGFTIGNHGYGHVSFESLSEGEVTEELDASQQVLTEILGRAPTILSYPHGRFKPVTVEVLKQHGIRYAVTIERRAVSFDDDPRLIPRFDAMDLVRAKV